jgi:phage baseplate assembly protein W
MIDLKITKLEPDNSISLSSGLSPTLAGGINKLIQQVVKMLLTTPGSDAWEPLIGGGLVSIISQVPSDDNIQNISSQVAIAVSDTERYLLKDQVSASLINEEILGSLTLESCEYDNPNNRWLITLRLKNVLNQSATINLG